MARRLTLGLALSLAILAVGCARKKLPSVTRVWVGPVSGCVDAAPNPTIGAHGCWGVNDASQLGDGTTTDRVYVTAMPRAEGKLTELSIGARHACAVFDGRTVYCWGDGARGQLGTAIAKSATPVATGDGGERAMVRVGDQHTCVRANDRLRCFGASEDGRLGEPSEWDRGADIRALALGDAHTCVAFGGAAGQNVANGAPPATPEPPAPRQPPAGTERGPHVLCRGRSSAAPTEPILHGVAVRALAAGGDHTCALLEDRTVRCWGKNDSGQLGDGTTTDSLLPVSVLDLQGVAELAVGAKHACALLANGTIACWGDNAVHQLSDGTTEHRSRPAVVVGLVQVRQLAAAGNTSCALLDGGFLRCWGPNDRGQLGDGSTQDHTVPMPPKFR